MYLVKTENGILLVDTTYENQVNYKRFTSQSGTECEELEYVSNEISIEDLKELISKY
jgi:hypothetical protein